MSHDDLTFAIDGGLAIIALDEPVPAQHDPALGIGEVALRGGLGRAGWACGFGPPPLGRGAVRLDDRLWAGRFLRSGRGFCLGFKSGRAE